MSKGSINPFYLNDDVLDAMKQSFARERSIAIAQALSEIKIPQLRWKRSDVPDMHRYETGETIPLQKELEKLIMLITGKNLSENQTGDSPTEITQSCMTKRSKHPELS